MLTADPEVKIVRTSMAGAGCLGISSLSVLLGTTENR